MVLVVVRREVWGGSVGNRVVRGANSGLGRVLVLAVVVRGGWKWGHVWGVSRGRGDMGS